VRKTFTLREFAELAVLARDAHALPADGSPGRRLSAVVAAAPRFRGQRTTGAHDDIEDPYGRELWNYARAMAQINECLTPLVAVLRD
jgi:protein-tyrosine phosphatase